jgi:hypothetical protein
MIGSLERAGIALSDMASAVQDGVLSFAFLDLPVSIASQEARRQTSES